MPIRPNSELSDIQKLPSGSFQANLLRCNTSAIIRNITKPRYASIAATRLDGLRCAALIEPARFPLEARSFLTGCNHIKEIHPFGKLFKFEQGRVVTENGRQEYDELVACRLPGFPFCMRFSIDSLTIAA